MVCVSRLQGADTIDRPSACHHPSLATFQIGRNAAERKPVFTFLMVNRSPVILKCQPYLQTDMVFESLLTTCMTVSIFLLFKQHGNDHGIHSRSAAPMSQSSVLGIVLLVVMSIHPVSVKIYGRKVTYLKYAATGASHSKFCEVLEGHEDKACLLFQPWWCTLKYREKKSHGSLCCICSRPVRGDRGDISKASTQQHAHVHAESALDAFKLFSTPCYELLHIPLSAVHRNLRNYSAHKKNLGQSSFWQGTRPGRWTTLMKAAQ